VPLLLLIAGCSGRTQLIVDINSSDPTPLSSLTMAVSIEGAAARSYPIPADGSPPILPGRALVILPDAFEQVTVGLTGVDLDGLTLSAMGVVPVEPHHQEALTLTLAIGGPDGGSGDLATADAAIADLAGADLPGGIIAQDDYVRPDRLGWGKASDGQFWQGDPSLSGSGAFFSIVTNTGECGPGASGAAYTGWLGPSVADQDVTVTVSIASAANTNIGVAARVLDTSNMYAAELASNDFRIVAVSGGAENLLQKTNPPFFFTASTSYTIRLSVVGTTVQAKAWPSSKAEPSAWLLSTTDSSFAVGFPGIRVLPGSSAARYTHFLAVAP
jgi:hypothetical protein